jgi:hypothetical protein
MATEIALEVKVNSGSSVNAVKDLKKEIKELESLSLQAGNAGNEALSRKYAAAAGAARDKMADFKKEIQGVSDAGSKLGAIAQVGSTIASGFQAAAGASALFGASGKDLEKVLLKVQAATALAQGAQALANATEDIAIAKKVVYTTVTNIASAASKAFGISAAAAAAVATAGITLLVGAVIGLIAYFNNATAASEQLAEQEKKRKEQALAANKFQEDSQLKAIENELKLAQAEGKSADEILAIRKRLLNAKIDIIKQEENALETTVERSRELSLQRQDLETEIAVADAERNRQRVEDAKKTSNEINKVKEDEVKKLAFKSSALVVDPNEPVDTAEGQRIADAQSLNALLASIGDEARFQEVSKEKQMIDEINAYKKQEDEKELSRKKNNLQFGLEATRDGLQAISSLVVATAGKNESAQRRAFNFQKKVNIATATIDTYLAAQKAYASQIIPADPTSVVRGAIAAGIAITSGLARVAIIARTQFNSGGGGGGATAPEGGGGGSIATPNAPTIPTFNPQGTIIPQNNNNKNEAVKAYVLEDDVSSTQNRIRDIKTKALYG